VVRRAWLLVLALAVLAVPGLAAARSLQHWSAGRVRPRTFGSCAQLVGYARHGLGLTRGVPEPAVLPVGGPVGTVPPVYSGPTPTPTAGAPGQGGAPSFSTTNNQEPGVDEPDIVKTDGARIFAISQGTLYAVDAGGSTPKLAGSLSLGATGYGAQLLLHGRRLIVVSSGFAYPVGVGVPAPGGGSAMLYPYRYGGQTVITEVDVSDPAAMKVTRTMTVDGTFVDARQTGSSARLVISSQPRAIIYPGARGEANGWVPVRRFHSLLTGRRYAVPIAPCRTIRRPVEFSGLGMLTILTIDLDRGLYATDAEALMADARVVYGSQDSLYIATQKWIDPRTPVDKLPQSQSTVIDKFDVTDPLHTTLLASGEVPGCVLNQFSMSEYKGDLRVATTSRPIWWDAQPPQALSQSYVTVLRGSGPVLVPVGQVAGLGAGQQIYSVRFVADAGYVVTFRRVDPLYTIDLSDPSAPRVAGKLELEGYSSYLHPLGNGLLLGIGQDVGAGNEPAGSQLELFDVSDPSAPRLLARTSLGGGSYSEALYDHHAFLYWPATKLAVLPVQIYPPVVVGPPVPPTGATGSAAAAGTSSSAEFVGAIGFHLAASGIDELGQIVHDPVNGYSPPIRRSLVIGNTLFTLSDEGVMASSLDTLARQAFVAFPQHPTPGVGAAGGARPTG
jgi:hypothetical protein